MLNYELFSEREMKKPIILTNKQLLVPLNQALKKIEEIEQVKNLSTEKILYEGLFAILVAKFEYALSNTMEILLNNIPQKLDFKTESISKDELIYG